MLMLSRSSQLFSQAPSEALLAYLYPQVFEATYLSTCALPHMFAFVFVTTDTLGALKNT